MEKFGTGRKISNVSMSLVNQTPKFGKIILFVSGSFFLWFTIWMLVSPFYDDPCMLHYHRGKSILLLSRFPSIFPGPKMGYQDSGIHRYCDDVVDDAVSWDSSEIILDSFYSIRLESGSGYCIR
jgi:hypothetical protein